MCDHVFNMQRILNHTYLLTLICITNLASSLWVSNNHNHNQLNTQREETLLLYILKLILECQPCHHSQDSVRYSKKKFNMLLCPEVCYFSAWMNVCMEEFLVFPRALPLKDQYICSIWIFCNPCCGDFVFTKHPLFGS